MIYPNDHRMVGRLPIVLLAAAVIACGETPPTGMDPNTPPDVSIVTPADGTSHDLLTMITFEGTASDAEDGANCCDDGYRWSLLDGTVLGTGRILETDVLPNGVSRVVLAVTDSDGSVGADTVEVVVSLLSEIAYDEDGMIKVFDGNQERALTEGQNPTWSPDGTRIAFARGGGITREIFVINTDGSGLRQLTDNDVYDHKPTWSPDGTQLAFVRANDEDDNEIHIMLVANGETKKIATVDEADEPDWGDAGILFQDESGDDEEREIALVEPGSFPVRLTGNEFDDNDASWSFDDTRIVFSSLRDGNDEVYIMDADGDNQIRLTDDPAKDDEPHMSPDGTRIAFERQVNGVTELFVMRPDGTGVTRLLSSSTRSSRNHPRWKPEPVSD